MSAFADLSAIAPQEIWAGAAVRTVHGERITLGAVELDPGAVVPEHRHENEQLGIVLSGSLRFRVGDEARVPIVETLRHHWRAVLITIGAKLIETATFFTFATFTISYASQTLKYKQGVVLNAVLVAAVIIGLNVFLLVQTFGLG